MTVLCASHSFALGLIGVTSLTAITSVSPNAKQRCPPGSSTLETPTQKFCVSTVRTRMTMSNTSRCPIGGPNTPSKEVPQFCTTDANIEPRREQFSFSELPKTFQDAIHITRNLGISYVRIDSLCIIQWNDADWKHEAKRIEEAFASAYCTIAATSAADSKAGFLKRNVQSEVIYAQDLQDRRFYVCADRDDSGGYVDIDDFRRARGEIAAQRASMGDARTSFVAVNHLFHRQADVLGVW